MLSKSPRQIAAELSPRANTIKPIALS